MLPIRIGVAVGLTAVGLVTGAGGLFARSTPTFAALPLSAPSPADNPSTPQKVALGRLLFWDPILSTAGDTACATCHHPSLGYGDGRELPIGTGGVGMGRVRKRPHGRSPFVSTRNSPSLVNVAFNGIDRESHIEPILAPMFWDSRLRGLEAQALEPIKAIEELRGDHETPEQAVRDAVSRIGAVAEYRELFRQVYGTDAPVSAVNVARAIATFERSLVAANSPFDRYMRGDMTAMTPLQTRGMAAFERRGCAQCHNGPLFSDAELHVIGVPAHPSVQAPDLGAGARHAFRTPSLRNLAFSAPYMHNGVFATVDRVLAHYVAVRFAATVNVRAVTSTPSGTVQPAAARPGVLDPLLLNVDAAAERTQILAFLDALGDGSFDQTIPQRVPSGLRPGGDIGR